MKKILIALLVLTNLSTMVRAEIYNLDLEKCIAIAKEKSLSMKQLQQTVKIYEFNLKAATSSLKTQVNMNLVAPQYTESMTTITDSIVHFFRVKQLNYSGVLTINQPLPTDGNIFIRSSLSDYDDYFAKTRSSNLSTRLVLSQPILSLYGYNSIQATLKEAKLSYESSVKSMKREQLNLIYNVSSAFFSLLTQKKSEEIALLNLNRQKEAYSIAKNKYDAGLIKEVEALQMEVDLAEAQNNYDLACINQSSAVNDLKSVLGVNLTDSLILSSAMDYKIVIVNPEKAVQLAMNNRTEIREMEIAIELNKLNIKSRKSQGMIKGDLEAYLGMTGVNGQSLSSSFSSSVTNAYNDLRASPKNYGIGFNVSIPIIDWGQNRARVNSAKAQLQRNLYSQEETKRNIEIEIRNLVSELNSSLSRLQLLEKNVVVAEKSFSITRQRFSDGNIDSQALALELERLNNAYNSHLRSYINYQLMLANIMRKTFYDFQRDESIN